MLLALATSGCGAVEQTRLRRGGSDDTDFSKMPENIQGMLQGTMLLAAALPHHGAPPSKDEADQMEEAGQLLFKSYTMLQNADNNLGAASEQLKLQASSGMKAVSSVASGIADAESMIQSARDMLKKGEGLKRKAHDSFFNNANPLGDPPVAPHEWDNVNAIGMRANSKLNSVSSVLKDAKKMARQQGVALSDIVVSAEHSVLLQDAYGAGKDNEILNFLNGY